MRERILCGSPADSFHLVELLTDDGRAQRPSRFALRIATRDGTWQERNDLSLVELRALHAGIQRRLFAGNDEMRQRAILQTAKDAGRGRHEQRD